MLHLSESDLEILVVDAEQSYNRYPLRTRKRRPRWIEAPKPLLKRVQRRLLEQLLYGALPHETAHGFFPGRSILTNASSHAGKAWVLSCDLKDFFPSTKEAKVEDVLKRFYGFGEGARAAVLRLVCRGGALPQGAPTSPHLANLAFFDGDEESERLAQEHGLAYTRYADDITLSGDSLPDDLEARIEEIVAPIGYRLAKEKTKRMGRHQCQKVTGLVVNDGVKLPRAQRRRLRAIRRDLETKGPDWALARSGYRSASELAGHLAFGRMVAVAQ
jgi:retron-type reverse transcriptase